MAEAGAVSRPSKLVTRLVLVIEQHERAAADAGGFRFDKCEHHLRGDGRIDRASARTQDFETGLRGIRACRRDHVFLRGLFESVRGDAREEGEEKGEIL